MAAIIVQRLRHHAPPPPGGRRRDGQPGEQRSTRAPENVRRWRRDGSRPLLESWAHAFAVGQPLPTLPLWLADHLAVPVELEASYEETCRILRID